jgi:cob(I)alamin adenosyltransferase
MVHITSVYTRQGDKGQTRLSDGTEVPKTHPRMMACGEIDEMNSLLGIIASESIDPSLREEIARIQNDLFDLGSDVASPIGCRHESHIPRITGAQVDWLERRIDAVNAELSALDSFILPGGCRVAALLHLARTVVRRAERQMVALLALDYDGTNLQALAYCNRLSDWCFVQSRRANDNGAGDVLWKPGANR